MLKIIDLTAIMMKIFKVQEMMKLYDIESKEYIDYDPSYVANGMRLFKFEKKGKYFY